MHFPSLLLVIVALQSVSCQGVPDTDQQRTRIASLLNARRPGSLGFWKDKSIMGQSPPDFGVNRMAILLPPDIEPKIKHTVMQDTVRVSIDFTTRKTLTAGSAVAVTTDGYFLTAAHCFEVGPRFTLISFNNSEGATAAKARVVWRGDYLKDGPDLALIQAPVRPENTLTPTMAAIQGGHILTLGFGSHGLPRLVYGASGGKINYLGPVHQTADGARWREIGHTAPMAPGDSGGPLIGEAGELLGINVTVGGAAIFPLGLNQIWRYQGTAIAADPDWISKLIQKDRETRKTRNRR
ncbi:MAG: serine protease [Verrucomicrobiota bacterium]